MTRLLKILLPYSLLAGIGVAIAVSSWRPASEVVSTEPAKAAVEMDYCSGCGTPVSLERAVDYEVSGKTLSYCCSHCYERHERAGFPPVAPKAARQPVGNEEARLRSASTLAVDPVCHMEVNPSWGFEVEHHGQSYYFCTEACRDQFAAAPTDYLGDRCIVCGELIASESALASTYLGKTYYTCCEEHRSRFKADPASYFMHTMWGIPSWMYYLSIAMVLVVSFGCFEWIERWFGGKKLSSSVAMSALVTSGGPTPARTANRINLFASSAVGRLARSRFFRFTLQAFFVAVFFVIVAAGLFGNQNPALNIAPLLTWTIWWGGLVILIMFAGKAWCYVCPWDATAGWMEKLRFWKKNDEGLGLNLKWPRALRNVLVATVLFVGLTWIELGFGVTMRPRVTAYLAIAMLLMAIVSAFLFEKKSFCRYGCLVGRVSGLYALFSGTEVRAKDASICKGCRGKECVRGSETAYGCPTFLYPGNLAENTYCIQCMECVQACPEDNLTVNLRPWGADLVSGHKWRRDEAYLALLMLSITGFHGLTMTPNWARLTSWLSESFSLGNLLSFSIGMAALMLAPILIYALLIAVSYRFGTQRLIEDKITYHEYFVRYSYALLPIALFYHLAHNLEHLLMEGPKVVSLASDPFGYGWNLFGTLDWHVPPLISLDVLWVLQIALVLIGHVYSLWVAQKTSVRLFGNPRAAFRSQLPMLAGMILFSIFSLWLLKQPMEMRTSAM